ncbi:hypothetical protein EZY14_001875 [Kordia sp. TARA_039_SRF]|nr:hypothetical protein EZY14_001875 [Kordia sp. TARA_039_SRF]
MINILILEDTQADFEKIVKFIGQIKGQDQIKIYPNISKEGTNKFKTQNYTSDWHYVREMLEKKYSDDASKINDFFDEIMNTFKDINIYIVDINLIGLEDRLGIKFLEYVDIKSDDDKKEYVIISTDTYAGEISIDENKYCFISKYNSISNIERELIFRIEKLIKKQK